MDIRYETIEQPKLKPLEIGWQEEVKSYEPSERTKRIMEEGEAQIIRNAEERA